MSRAGEGTRSALLQTRLADRALRLARLAGGGGDRTLAAVPHALRPPAETASEVEPEDVKPDVKQEPAAVVPFQRPTERRAVREALLPALAGDLDRLAGAGPGLIWALEHAGIRNLADLAAGSSEDLADRLGPIGGLVDLAAWIDFARRAGEAPA